MEIEDGSMPIVVLDWGEHPEGLYSSNGVLRHIALVLLFLVMGMIYFVMQRWECVLQIAKIANVCPVSPSQLLLSTPFMTTLQMRAVGPLKDRTANHHYF
jgi:hypothetical protein